MGSLKRIKIVSGGQTGADRVALAWAIANRMPHGGWCPKGRKAENGAIPRRYRLVETRSSSSAVRTRWNVRDSDGTVVFSSRRRLFGGTKLTADLARELNKPLLVLSNACDSQRAARLLDAFLEEHQIRVLNRYAAPASTAPASS